MQQSGFAPIELPAALIVFGLLTAGTLYLFASEFPWYYYRGFSKGAKGEG